MNRKQQAEQLLKEGKTRLEIAQILGVTKRTVQRDLLNVINVTPKFKRYKKPGQKYLTKQNIEDMVTANEAKIEARKQRGETYNALDTEQAFIAGRQQL